MVSPYHFKDGNSSSFPLQVLKSSHCRPAPSSDPNLDPYTTDRFPTIKTYMNKLFNRMFGISWLSCHGIEHKDIWHYIFGAWKTLLHTKVVRAKMGEILFQRLRTNSKSITNRSIQTFTLKELAICIFTFNSQWG